MSRPPSVFDDPANREGLWWALHDVARELRSLGEDKEAILQEVQKAIDEEGQ